MNITLYSNRNSRSDFIQNAIDSLITKANNINIAVAFLTDTSVLENLSKQGCKVRIVVRLGFPTSPNALESLLKISNIEARFFSDSSFHPKLYIFGSSGALVGSANLTHSAMTTNQEIMVHIDTEDDIFTELVDLFSEYWKESKVLTPQTVKDYKTIYDRFKSLSSDAYKLEEEVHEKIGNIVSSNIVRDKTKQSKENIFIEDYRKTYQESVSAFNTIRQVYEKVGKRKISETSIPLRLEIDSFISFVRDIHAKKESWKNEPIVSGDPQNIKIMKLVKEWHQTPWPYFEKIIVNETYPRLKTVFASEKSISEASPDKIFEALCTLHSFHDRLRFYPGGLDTLKQEFLGKNDIDKIKKSLTYLVYGNTEIIERMANLIFKSEYKLNVFGQSNIQELIGWENKEGLPVINGRTTKILRYFGFNICQL
ncbi:MAG: NgoFVII family restriction endonuclease [Candidatus Competibacteraceae bacterium]|nr:NgoFVII family restriction endonuclease [Candidatus Competibacteraceae bacterium]